MLLVTAPSGAGKTSIVKHLLARIPSLAFSVSATTRTRREHEIHGQDYYFVDEAAFKKYIESGALTEWQEVYPGRFYGTLASEVERLWQLEKCIVFDIDVLGALNLKSQFREQALSIFIAPPSIEELSKRLQFRGTETPESLKVRLERAEMEMTYQSEFDMVIVNDDLTKACQLAEKRVRAFLTEH